MPAPVPAQRSPVGSEPSAGRRGPRPLALVRAVVALVAAGMLLWWAVPHVTGAAWSDVLRAVTAVPLRSLALLAGVWVAGLYANTFVLTGALPGLTHRRALTLNLTGSAVSNAVPFGGALGVALNLRMVRTWRFPSAAYAAYAVATNLWDVVGKLSLPLAALAALTVTGHSTGVLRAVGLVAVAVLAVMLLTVAVILRSDRVGVPLLGAVAALVVRATPSRWRARTAGTRAVLLDTRDRLRTVVARSGAQMSAGTVAYLLLQALLLAACLHVVGAGMSAPDVLAAFAVERVLTLAVITPGGSGLAEAGAAGVLVALGGDPVGVAAGVLLYRAFTFLLEIPVGGAWLGAWLLARRRQRGPLALGSA